MNRYTHPGGEDQSDSHWLPTRRRLDVTLMLLVFGLACFLLWIATYGSKAKPPGIVILGTSITNGEQLLTFRPDPPGAEILSAELVDVLYDGKTQPQTIRRFGHVLPIPRQEETNCTLRFIALPQPGRIFAGGPCASTPGSYTVAYTPSANAHRVRIGVADRQPGISGYARWLRGCWERRTFTPSWREAYGYPFYVTTTPFTNEEWTTP